MIKLEPVLTEKSLKNAAEGKYTFFVDRGLNKYQIRKHVEEIFGVSVVKVRTLKKPGEKKRTVYGRKKIIKPRKKAIVTLKEGEKIKVFEEVK